MILILDNIRSIHNVGSIFRSADAAGVSELFLCGVTPDPIDRFGRDRSDLAKVSLGAEKSVSWRHFKDTFEAISFAKDIGKKVIALEQTEKSENYIDLAKSFDFKEVALVLGEETKGLPEEVLKISDVIAEIPMFGDKESLNVSVAAGIAMFGFRN